MAFDFPASPIEGQVYSPAGGPEYIYHAPVWEILTHVDVGQEYVLRTGDSMSGNLFITKVQPRILLNKSVAAEDALLVGQKNAVNRWHVNLGTAFSESGSDAGSNFEIQSYTDAGALKDKTLQINRASGQVDITKTLNVGSDVYPAVPAPGNAMVGWLKTKQINWNSYWDGAGLRNVVTGFAGSMTYDASIGRLVWYSTAASVAGGAVSNQPFQMYLDPNGSLTAVGDMYCVSSRPTYVIAAQSIQANAGAIISHSPTAGAKPGVACYSSSRAVSMGMWLDVDNRLTFGDMGGSAEAINPFVSIHSSGFICNRVASFNSNLAIGGTLTVGGAASVNSVTAAGLVNAGTAVYANWNYGVQIQGASGGSTIIAYMIQANPTWNAMQMNATHVAGAWAGIRWYIGPDPMDFRNGGLAYKAGGGPWSDISDARIKDVKSEYKSGLEELLNLRPVVFTYRGNDTDEAPRAWSDAVKEEEVTPQMRSAQVVVPYPNSFHYQSAVDQKEFVGLIAQEAEAKSPDIVTRRKGWIDGVAVDDLRDVDQGRLIFKAINAIKELHQKILDQQAEIDILKAAQVS